MGSIPQYLWGTIAYGFSNPDAVLSGTNRNRRSGDKGVCKPLLNGARGRIVETRVTRETGATEKMEEAAVAREAAAAQEMAAASEARTVTTPGAVTEEKRSEMLDEPTGFQPVQQTPSYNQRRRIFLCCSNGRFLDIVKESQVLAKAAYSNVVLIKQAGR
ncbi:hypothetical protein NDU88_005880 [Pleurodeles waltl]|uniref:Uncharacterized protein n=1 Tax=Pleurodeles waltl TaxID=8319 RepID=A0AAV7X000_PLEWA|nr:hypothetical protein NDU88_005880 [Pleurodeles waltl]